MSKTKYYVINERNYVTAACTNLANVTRHILLQNIGLTNYTIRVIKDEETHEYCSYLEVLGRRVGKQYHGRRSVKYILKKNAKGLVLSYNYGIVKGKKV